MRPVKVLQVAHKEILSTLRDRRALVSSLLIPLLILPLVMLGLPLLLGGLFEREQDTLTEVAVLGLENLPAPLLEAIEGQNLQPVSVDDPEAGVRSGDYQLGLEVPDALSETVTAGGADELVLYSKRGNLRSEFNAGKLEAAVASYRDEIVGERLAAAGLDPAVLEPVTTRFVDASTETERQGGQFAWLIPFFIAVWTLAGGQMTAIDATAGEKERGTLEALLVAPVRRAEIVVGKFFATLAFGLAAALMAILGYVLGGTVLRRAFLSRLGPEANDLMSVMGGSLSVTPLSLTLLVVSALLLAALIAALLISITLFARSFKEAQTYVAPLSFLLVVPILGLQFADFFGTNVLVYLVPLLNALLLMDDIVKGNAATLPVLLTWGSLIGVSALLLDVAYRSFKREGVIFRT